VTSPRLLAAANSGRHNSASHEERIPIVLLEPNNLMMAALYPFAE
jgi:hypothetical protein